MEDCIFCKIAQKKVPALVLLEKGETLGFLELTPSAPGHSMVIHKKHGVSLLDYSQEELGEIMVSVQMLARTIKKALDCESITIGINHLEPKGIPHLHVHLIPRWSDDHGVVMQGIVKNQSTMSREEIAEKIKKVL